METNNITLAKAIDFINKWTINYYTHDISEEPDPYKIQEALHKELEIDYKYFEYAYRIMKSEGFIEYLSNEDADDQIREFRHTDKGLLLYLNGGMEQQVVRNRTDKELAQKQVQSVIDTNKTQRVVLILTTGLAALSIFISWLAYNNTTEVKIMNPIQVEQNDTLKIIEMNHDINDSLTIIK